MNRTILNVAALEALDRRGLRPDTHKVALGSALLWTYRTPTELQRLMSLSGLPTTETKRVFSATDVKVALSELRRKDLLVDDPTRPAACQLVDSLRVPLYRQLLETHTGDRLARMVVEADSIDPTRSSAGFYGPMGGIPTTIAYVRAKFFSGAPSDELTQIRNTVARSMEWCPILTRAILFGGLTVIVPEGVRVENQGISIFGGSDVKDASPVPGAPTVRLRGMCLFGGVSVKAKPRRTPPAQPELR